MRISKSTSFLCSTVVDFVPLDYPLRRIRSLVDEALETMHSCFTVSCAHTSRPSVASERVIRELLLEALYSIPSERRLVNEILYNMLYRGVVGQLVNERMLQTSVFSKNHASFVDHDINAGLLQWIVQAARQRRLLSDQHSGIAGDLIDIWAAQANYRRGHDNDTPLSSPPYFKCEPRRFDSHEYKTDPDVRRYRESGGQPEQLCCIGYALAAKRHVLALDAPGTRASSTADVDAVLETPGQQLSKESLTGAPTRTSASNALSTVPPPADDRYVVQGIRRRLWPSTDGQPIASSTANPFTPIAGLRRRLARAKPSVSTENLGPRSRPDRRPGPAESVGYSLVRIAHWGVMSADRATDVFSSPVSNG